MSSDNAPRIQTRPVDEEIYRQSVAEGFSALQARVIGARLTRAVVERAGGKVSTALRPPLSLLTNPSSLPDIDRAAHRIAQAILRHEHILLSCDHDADGVDAGVVLYQALVRHFGASPERVHLLTTDRMTEGYGFTLAYLDRAFRAHPDVRLIITADQGSCDEPAIQEARRRGAVCIVSDHHLLPSNGPPASAFACVNPSRDDASAFGDPMIAGCMVAWLLMTAVRRQLLALGHLAENAPPLAGLLQCVAVGTTADAVSLGESLNNRAVVWAGLQRMNSTAVLPGLAALHRVASRDPENPLPITATTLGWDFGSRLNAAGRLDTAMPGARLLLATSPSDAQSLAQELDDANKVRRTIQAGMVEEALSDAQWQVDGGSHALVVVFPEGHQGVHGIVSGRLVQRFGRPTICLSPKRGQPGKFSGSVRSVPGFHARDALRAIHEKAPEHGGVIAFGGHAMASGVTVDEAHLPVFAAAFEAQARECLRGMPLGPWIDIDGDLCDPLSMALVEDIEALDPYGRGAELPRFGLHGEIVGVRTMGDGTHLRLTLETSVAGRTEVAWFNARTKDAVAAGSSDLPAVGSKVRAIVAVSRNRYRGKDSAQLTADHVIM